MKNYFVQIEVIVLELNLKQLLQATVILNKYKLITLIIFIVRL